MLRALLRATTSTSDSIGFHGIFNNVGLSVHGICHGSWINISNLRCCSCIAASVILMEAFEIQHPPTVQA